MSNASRTGRCIKFSLYHDRHSHDDHPYRGGAAGNTGHYDGDRFCSTAAQHIRKKKMRWLIA